MPSYSTRGLAAASLAILGASFFAAAPAHASSNTADSERLTGSLVLSDTAGSYVPAVLGLPGRIGVGSATTSEKAASEAALTASLPGVGTSGVVRVGDLCVTHIPSVTLAGCNLGSPSQQFTTVKVGDALRLQLSSFSDAVLTVAGNKLSFGDVDSAHAARDIVLSNFTPETSTTPPQKSVALENVFAIPTDDGAIIGGRAEAFSTITVSVAGTVVGTTKITSTTGLGQFGLTVVGSFGGKPIVVKATTTDGREASTTVTTPTASNAPTASNVRATASATMANASSRVHLASASVGEELPTVFALRDNNGQATGFTGFAAGDGGSLTATATGASDYATAARDATKLVYSFDGSHEITNSAGDQCLTAPNVREIASNDFRVRLETCDGNYDQQWDIDSAGKVSSVLNSFAITAKVNPASGTATLEATGAQGRAAAFRAPHPITPPGEGDSEAEFTAAVTYNSATDTYVLHGSRAPKAEVTFTGTSGGRSVDLSFFVKTDGDTWTASITGGSIRALGSPRVTVASQAEHVDFDLLPDVASH